MLWWEKQFRFDKSLCTHFHHKASSGAFTFGLFSLSVSDGALMLFNIFVRGKSEIVYLWVRYELRLKFSKIFG